jgi:2-polyprenyl-3-methyl-5-hydroxy-6-metoxy-1,4-benzoquinol methylase
LAATARAGQSLAYRSVSGGCVIALSGAPVVGSWVFRQFSVSLVVGAMGDDAKVMTAMDATLAEQVRYYRARAGEYDATAYGDPEATARRLGGLVAELDLHGDVLEIACGTGMWTAALARRATSVTAIDAAPEMLDVARRRIDSSQVRFVLADVFSWSTAATFEVISFSAWLSHVPRGRFEEFWQLLRGLLAEGGRVLFVDEHIDQRFKETYTADPEIALRTLNNGHRFRIVKSFIDPAELASRLEQLGWHVRIGRDGSDWIVGEARPQ